MFERFTDRARRVVVLAQEEARMLNHNYIGTEHILLGLIHEGEGVAAKALESLGISLEAVRQRPVGWKSRRAAILLRQRRHHNHPPLLRGRAGQQLPFPRGGAVMASELIVSAQPAGEVSDPVLDALTDAAEADAELFRTMGDAAPELPEQNLNRPVDLRFNWAALTLRKPARGHRCPAETAELIPVLIASTITPFAQDGRRPPPIWGVGYEAQLADVEQAQTISVFPDSETVTKASMDKLTFRVGANGKISFPSAALSAAMPVTTLLPGLTVEASASADAGFQVAGVKFLAVKVIAGPVASGGAKWQFYREGQELAQAQHLFHVVLIPPGNGQLRIQAQATVTCRTWYGKKSAPMLWRAEPVVQTISQADLG
jgi:hypothetical protein